MPSDTYILTISEAGVSVPSSHASTHLTGGSDPIPVATTSTSGLMSAAIFNQHVTNTAKVSNVTHTGDVTDTSGVLTVNKINGVSLGGLGGGVLKVADGTGIPSIATAADYPILNQNTTGNAATATLATTATNLAGGSTGALPYQTVNGGTAMLSSGASGTVLKSNGAAAPSWSAVEKSMLSTALSNEITANTAKVSNVTHTGDVTDTAGVLKVTKINNVALSGLATGILKNTTSTGEPSIAVAADFPVLNQNTTGNAATATYATTAGSTSTATSLIGGSMGSVPYQTSSGNTSMLASGASGTVLKSNGAAAPSWSAVEKSMLSTALSNEITANTAKVSNVTHTGDVTDTAGVLKVTKINNVALSGLATGILKNTTSTGEPSIAVAADFPILNQNTTGNAATATYASTADHAVSADTALTATSANSTTNLSGGAVGSIPYQTSSGNTAMLVSGSSGTILKSNGAAAPSWSAVEKSMLSTALSNEITANTAKVSNVTHTGDVTDTAGVLKVTKINNVALSGLATGILKNTTSTGEPSIAVAADFPILNQNTTGNAATATNLSGGNIGSIPYQSATGVTSMLPTATSGFLRANGLSAPSWANMSFSDLTGTVSVSSGGTGLSSYSIGDILFASTNTALSKLSSTEVGDVLLSGGINNAPSYGKVGLTTHVSGTLPVANGGTGAATLTGYVKGTGTTAMTASATIPTSDLSGSISVANGGTGASTLTGYVKGNGTTAMTASATIPTSDLSGSISVANGGTGATTLTGYVKGNGTTAMTASATVPVADISGTLPVANGGTGAATLTGYVKGTGTTAMTASATVPVADISGILPVANGGTASDGTAVTALTFDTLKFKTTDQSSTTLTEGQLRWNSVDKTLDLKMAGANVTQQVGQELLMYVTALESITNGQVVYISGSFDGVPEVSLASSDSTTSNKVIGVATEDIAIGGNGYVTLTGIVRGLNLSSYTSGQDVWLSTFGEITGTEPTYPSYKVRVGFVISAEDGTGAMYVSPKFFENGTVNGTGKIGYLNGSGGTVTQNTSKSTSVTLNTTNGQITMNAATLAQNTSVSFTLINSRIEAGDVLITNHISGGDLGNYLISSRSASGSATINLRNVSGGSLSDAVVIAFAVIKAVTI